MKNNPKHTGHSPLMNSMHLLDEGLALAADALRLNKFHELPEGLQSHLGECQECRIAVMELFYIIESADEGAQVEFPPFFTMLEPPIHKMQKKSGPLWLKIAAALLLLLLPFGLLQIGDAMKTIQRIGKYFALSVNPNSGDPFQPDPMMEPLAQMIFRGSGIQVITPLVGDSLVAGRPVYFRWIDQNSKPVNLSLQDNRGKIIAHLSIYRENFIVESLSPGRYYWKLESDKELLYLGSFVVSSD